MNAPQQTGISTAGAFRFLSYAQYLAQRAKSAIARRLFAGYVELEAKWRNQREQMAKALIDQEACTGCGRCSEICPAVFEMGAGTAKVRVARVPAEVEAACCKALHDCPVGAIAIET